MTAVNAAKYTAEQLRDLVKKGQAMGPDGSYPCADRADIERAVQAVGRGSGSHDAIRRHIIKNARRLDAMDLIPDNWNSDGTMKASAEESTMKVAAAKQGRPFTVLMMVEGLETCDGRMWELGTTTWRDPATGSFPLMIQDTSTHGPGQQPAPSWLAGSFDRIERDPEDSSRILGYGHLLPGEDGVRAETIIRHGFRGVSIDGYDDHPLGPVTQPTVVDQNGDTLQALIRYSDTVLTRLTLVPTPAFEAACIWFDDEEQPPMAAAAHGAAIDPDAEPEVMQNPNAVYELLVASAGGPLNPPKEWFFQPEPDHRQEIIVMADGRLCGHLFGHGECHIGNNVVCDMAPPSRTTPPFVGFHRTEAHCADGSKVACGWIPVNTDHSPISNGRRAAERWSQEDTWSHYENSGTLVAKVRASNGRHGVWLSGCLLPGLADRELAIAQGLSVSGHWNVYTDPRDGRRYPDELLAVLGGVPFPGYPETRTRPELLVASGQVIAHIGGLGCECDECADEGETMNAADQNRVERIERVVATLLAHATPEAIAAIDDHDRIGLGIIDPSDAAAHPAAAKYHAGKAAIAAAAAEPEQEVVEELTVDVGPPTAAERAAAFAKYDADARAVAAAAGHALRDGSFVIEDDDDLLYATRVAAAEGREDLAALIAAATERLAVSA